MDAFASVDSQVGKVHKQNDTQRDWQAWRSAGAGKPRAGADAAGAADDEDKVKSGGRGGDKKRPAPALTPSAVEDTEAEEVESDRWVPLQEPGTGESYWFNVATGATRREPPGAVLDGGGSSSSFASAVGGRGAKRQAINPILQAQAALERHLASAASARDVAATGAAGRSAHQVAAAAAERADAWVESVDPLSRNTYYTNRVSGETRWERPAVLDPAAASPAAAAPAARAAPGAAKAGLPASAAAAQAPQPACKLTWTRGIEDGKPFWLCRETGETRFLKPPP